MVWQLLFFVCPSTFEWRKEFTDVKVRSVCISTAVGSFGVMKQHCCLVASEMGLERRKEEDNQGSWFGMFSI